MHETSTKEQNTNVSVWIINRLLGPVVLLAHGTVLDAADAEFN